MAVGRSKRRRPAEERVDILAIAQAQSVETNARLAATQERQGRDFAVISQEFAEIKVLFQTIIEMIDRLPGKIGFGKPPAT